MNSILQNVAVQWLIRRVPDWGGWIGTFATFIVGIYLSMPPDQQAVFQLALSGNWQEITLGSLVPLLVLIWSQRNSFKATVRPQTVVKTVGGKSVRIEPDRPAANHQRQIAPPRRTLWDVLTGR